MFQTVPDTSSYVKVRQHRHYEQVMSEETRLELLNCLFPLPSLMTEVNGLLKPGFPDSPLAIFDSKWTIQYEGRLV